MKLVIIYISFLLSLQCLSAQIFNDKDTVAVTDSALLPVIQIKPDTFEIIIDDTTKFSINEVKVLNKGASPLIIEKVQGSCGCSTASIVDAVVYPMTLGKIVLSINMKGLAIGQNYVEYLVYSNAKNSPVSIKISCKRRE